MPRLPGAGTHASQVAVGKTERHEGASDMIIHRDRITHCSSIESMHGGRKETGRAFLVDGDGDARRHQTSMTEGG
jgi:hypothetical protein